MLKSLGLNTLLVSCSLVSTEPSQIIANESGVNGSSERTESRPVSTNSTDDNSKKEDGINTISEVRNLLERTIRKTPGTEAKHIKSENNDSPVHMLTVKDSTLCEQTDGSNAVLLINPLAFVPSGTELTPAQKDQVSFVNIAFGRMCEGEEIFEATSTKLTAKKSPEDYKAINRDWFTIHEQLNAEEKH